MPQHASYSTFCTETICSREIFLAIFITRLHIMHASWPPPCFPVTKINYVIFLSNTILIAQLSYSTVCIMMSADMPSISWWGMVIVSGCDLITLLHWNHLYGCACMWIVGYFGTKLCNGLLSYLYIFNNKI